MTQYETVIGLEVHVQLKTKTKLFCDCLTQYGEKPNSMICPICLGLPGTLPILNQRVVDFALMTGLALNCKIQKNSSFDRKNYFYPDLPKGYQVTQFYKPICVDGRLELWDEDQQGNFVEIKQIHIEEDAAKLVYEGAKILIDYNRAGTPLLEIVTTPSISSPEMAEEFLSQLKNILTYLDVSDCNMEEGSLRCDANISLRPKGQEQLGVKTEIKNMNSFRALKNALNYEIERQRAILIEGGEVVQETRTWDEGQRITISMRKKEEAQGYRYFPDPDMLTLVVDASHIDKIQKKLPELPQAKYQRLQDQYKLAPYAAGQLVNDRGLAQFFEEVAQEVEPIEASKWVLGDFLALLNEEKKTVQEAFFKSHHLVELLQLLEKGTISSRMAKEIFSESFPTGKAPSKIVAEKGLQQIDSVDELSQEIDMVCQENQEQVADYLGGNERVFQYLVGQVMKRTKGKASPQLTSKLLKDRLERGL